MWNKLLIYGIIYPFSWLPSRLLYGFSDVMYLILYHLFQYRRSVVCRNLNKSFPEKSKAEIINIERQFYHHLCDLVVEGVINLRLSKKEVLKRYHCINPEILDPFYAQSQSVILMSSHYNNWEYMVLSLGLQFHHHGVGVGKPLSNQSFGTILNRYRSRFGTEIIDASNVREKMAQYYHEGKTSAYMMLSDQSPSNHKRCYWTQFLNQETGFLYGSEYFAKKYEFPVFYYEVRKVRRGYYEFELTPLELSPNRTSPYQITEEYVGFLTRTIQSNPIYWLWTHKRWKLKRQEDKSNE